MGIRCSCFDGLRPTAGHALAAATPVTGLQKQPDHLAKNSPCEKCEQAECSRVAVADDTAAASQVQLGNRGCDLAGVVGFSAADSLPNDLPANSDQEADPYADIANMLGVLAAEGAELRAQRAASSAGAQTALETHEDESCKEADSKLAGAWDVLPSTVPHPAHGTAARGRPLPCDTPAEEACPLAPESAVVVAVADVLLPVASESTNVAHEIGRPASCNINEVHDAVPPEHADVLSSTYAAQASASLERYSATSASRGEFLFEDSIDTVEYKDVTSLQSPYESPFKEALQEMQVTFAKRPNQPHKDGEDMSALRRAAIQSAVDQEPVAARQVQHGKDMLPVTVPTHLIDGETNTTSCFCGFDPCCAMPVDQHELPKKPTQEPTMVSHGDRLDVVWRVVAKTFIRKDMAVDAPRIFPLDDGDEVTVTAIVDAELRTIAPAVGWVSLVTPAGEPLVMLGGSEATPPQSYPAVDLGEAFLLTITRDDVEHAAVLAKDLIRSGGLDAVHLTTIRRAIAEGRSSWGEVSQMLDTAAGNWDPPSNLNGMDFCALKAIILHGDSGRADSFLRNPRAAAHLQNEALPGPYLAMVEELLAMAARRAAKAKRRTPCACGMSTCAKCSSSVWEKVLYSTCPDQEKARMAKNIQALSALENSSFIVHVDTDANSSGTYEYDGEESFRPVYRLGKSDHRGPTVPRRLLRWQPGRGYDGEWRLLAGESLTPLYCATQKGCSSADSWLPPRGQWRPIGDHSAGRAATVQLTVRVAELPSMPLTLPEPTRATMRKPASDEVPPLQVGLAAPPTPTSTQRVKAPVSPSGVAAAPPPAAGSPIQLPTWQASFADVPDDAKAASKCVAGSLQSLAQPKPSRRAENMPENARYARFPKLPAESGWHLVSLCRLEACPSNRPRPVLDLLSGLEEEQNGEPEERLLSMDRHGQASVKPHHLGNILEWLGHSQQEVGLWKMTSDTLSIADFLAILACKFDIMEVDGDSDADLLDLNKVKAAFKALNRKGDGLLSPDELKSSMLNSRSTLSRFGLEEFCIELTDSEVEAMISFADTDGDGLINYEEFVEMMRSCTYGEA